MMTRQPMFRRYFSDFYKWNLIVFILFSIAYVLGLVWGRFSWGKYWLIPVLYLATLLSSLRLFVLFFIAVKDLKKNRIEEASIIVQGIVRDRKYNYYNKGGTMAGNEKCLLIDSDGLEYRAVLCHDASVVMHPREHYQNAQVKVPQLPQA